VTNDEVYQSIVDICRQCDQMQEASFASTGMKTDALGKDIGPCMDLWTQHDRRLSEPVRLDGVDFRKLLFRNHFFKKHAFVNCDFSDSRWFMAGFSDTDCSGSSFSGINAVLFGLTNVDCTGCNFSQAQLEFGMGIENAKFCGADFSGATLKLSNKFFAPKTAPDFTGAVMTGCKFINESQQARGVFKRWFNESQRAVMSVDASKARSGCFLATAACGFDSAEVAVLREFRDKLLLTTPAGRSFVKVYYCISPSVARRIEVSEQLRAAVRVSLVRPAASFARWRLMNTERDGKGR
jgi:uncharacterized protein YjbI with pentapeptide repeats